MKVLIACEESQAVCKAFRALGHVAYSCDIQECSGGHPEWHLKVDALEMLKLEWDLIIAHPPCTYLSNAGARWLWAGHKLNQERYELGLLGEGTATPEQRLTAFIDALKGSGRAQFTAYRRLRW